MHIHLLEVEFVLKRCQGGGVWNAPFKATLMQIAASTTMPTLARISRFIGRCPRLAITRRAKDMAARTTAPTLARISRFIQIKR
jgi:hypothetical protein